MAEQFSIQEQMMQMLGKLMDMEKQNRIMLQWLVSHAKLDFQQQQQLQLQMASSAFTGGLNLQPTVFQSPFMQPGSQMLLQQPASIMPTYQNFVVQQQQQPSQPQQTEHSQTKAVIASSTQTANKASANTQKAVEPQLQAASEIEHSGSGVASAKHKDQTSAAVAVTATQKHLQQLKQTGTQTGEQLKKQDSVKSVVNQQANNNKNCNETASKPAQNDQRSAGQNISQPPTTMPKNDQNNPKNTATSTSQQQKCSNADSITNRSKRLLSEIEAAAAIPANSSLSSPHKRPCTSKSVDTASSQTNTFKSVSNKKHSPRGSTNSSTSSSTQPTTAKKSKILASMNFNDLTLREHCLVKDCTLKDTLLDPEAMAKHVEEAHNGRSIICRADEQCLEIFSSIHEFLNHLKTGHSSVTEYACCDFRTREYSRFWGHYLANHVEHEYKCPRCSFKAKLYRELERHCILVHESAQSGGGPSSKVTTGPSKCEEVRNVNGESK